MTTSSLSTSALSLAASIGSQTFAQLVAKLTAGVTVGVSQKLAKYYETITSDYTPHLEATFNRCTKIKTILNRDEPVELLSHYVNLNFTCNSKTYDNYAAVEEINKRKKIVIWGTAGTGKTIFMKYLWLSFFENPRGRIPIFVELRNLNDISIDSLMVYLYHSIVSSKSNVTREVFSDAVKRGKFIFMFDGFDEIATERRPIFEKQILELANSNPNCTIVVSTRPDEKLAAWQLFSVLKVEPLKLPQVTDLIEKIKYDPKIKAKFLGRIKKDLYQKHQSFLSSPLLATMMLMTFDQFADIPEKVYLFYEQAFDTLFSRHDAVKEAFKRRMFTAYPIDLFKKYFSLFCLVSYHEQKFEFSEEEIRDYLKRGFNIEGAQVDTDLFLKDLLESVCIVQRDGLKYIFSHRSFQEFFTAYCLARMPRQKMGTILSGFGRRLGDDVLLMLFDMNDELVETEYTLPRLQQLAQQIEAIDKANFLPEFLNLMGLQLEVHLSETHRTAGTYIFKPDRGYDFLLTVRRMYPEIFPKDVRRKYAELDEGFLSNWREQLINEGELSRKAGPKSAMIFVDEKNMCLMRSRFRSLSDTRGRVDSTSEGRKSEPVPVDMQIFSKSGFAHHCTEDAERILALKSFVESKLAKKMAALDELFSSDPVRLKR